MLSRCFVRFTAAATGGGGGGGGGQKNSQLMTHLFSTLPQKKLRPVSAVEKSLPTWLLQDVTSQFGSFKNFLTMHADKFEVANNAITGIPEVRSLVKAAESERSVDANAVARQACTTMTTSGAGVVVPTTFAVPNSMVGATKGNTWIVTGVPAYLVPVTAVVRYLKEREQEQAQKATAVATQRLQQVSTPAATTSVRTRIGSSSTVAANTTAPQRKRPSPHLAFLDDVDAFVQHLQTDHRIDVVFPTPEKKLEEAYVRTLPPFKDWADAKANSALVAEQVQDYDQLRLARYLSCSEYVSIELLETTAATSLTKPLMHVVLSDPQKFDFRENDRTVKFIVGYDYMQQMVGTPMTLEEVEALRIKHTEFRRSKSGTEQFKSIKLRRRLAKAELQLKFPQGNVFFDPNVYAYYIFDLLPMTPVPMTDLKSLYLPENGEVGPPVTTEWLRSFPHLFFCFKPDAQFFVLRADAPRPNVPQPDDFTEHDLVAYVSGTKHQKDFDPNRSSAFSFITSKLPENVAIAIKKIGARQFIERHPDYFRIDNSKAKTEEVRIFYLK